LERKAVSGIMLTILLIGMLTLAFNIQPVKAEETVYIRPDGTVYPSTAPISRVGDVYTFTDNIYDSIVVQRDNIVIDGAGYTIQGTGAWGSKGIDLSTRENVTIQNMKIKTFWAGIGLYYASNNSIIGNNITNNNVCGVKLYFSSFNTITGNNIVNTAFYGIDVERSSNNTLSGNTMADNSLSIFLRESANNNIIAKNNITNGASGINLQRSNNNTIFENNIEANNGMGIWLSECSNNIISANDLTSNWCGLGLFKSSLNTVSGNDIKNNNFGGVYLAPLSSENIFYHNNFMNNIRQVYIETSGYTNFWDDGYPSGGNYWSDYTVRYPSAQELDGSGIWDTPYVIDENNQDNYPLMNPWTPTPPVITATVDIDPDTLNLRSRGKWITAYIQLLEGYTAAIKYVDGINADKPVDHGWSTDPMKELTYLYECKKTYSLRRIEWYTDWGFGAFTIRFREDVDGRPGEVLREVTFQLSGTSGFQGADFASSYPVTAGSRYWVGFYSEQETGSHFALSGDTIKYYIDWDLDGVWDVGPETWLSPMIKFYVEEIVPPDIDAATIMLNGTILPVLDPKYSFVTNSSEYLVDHNNDGVLERMVKFNRTEVSELTLSKGIMTGNVTLTITGQLTDGTAFEGSDRVQVRMPGDVNIDGKVDIRDIAFAAIAFGSYPTHLRWNYIADENEDNKIDIKDIALIAKNFGKTYP